MLVAEVYRRTLRVRQRPRPAPRRDEALIRVRLAGICNTDIELLRGYHDFRGVPGHEFVGQVEACRDARWVGERVVGEINLACGRCDLCRHDLPRHCRRRTVLGILGKDGAFAEYLTLPVQNLHRVPDSISDEAAVFVEPLAAACQILEQVPIDRRAWLAVIGDGKLAQLIGRVLQTIGANVTMIGKHPHKLRLAQEAGLETRLLRDVPKDWVAGCDIVVEATGSPAGMPLALRLVRPRGTVIWKSTFHGQARFDAAPLVVNEVTVIGSRCGPFERAIDLLRRKKVDPLPLVECSFSLSQAPRAIAFAQRPRVLKVLLAP
jgi:threonine dehydrogenase-like Zn-dependent dehydrogenase